MWELRRIFSGFVLYSHTSSSLTYHQLPPLPLHHLPPFPFSSPPPVPLTLPPLLLSSSNHPSPSPHANPPWFSLPHASPLLSSRPSLCSTSRTPFLSFFWRLLISPLLLPPPKLPLSPPGRPPHLQGCVPGRLLHAGSTFGALMPPLALPRTPRSLRPPSVQQ